MGRRAEGWKLLKRGGYYYVRFTHEGERHFVSTGQRDPQRAQGEAAKIYTEVVNGKRRTVAAAVVVATQPLDVIFAEWLASLVGVLDAETIKTYTRVYVRTHFLPWFREFDQINESNIGEYGRKRLREVMRRTMHKELGALRTFLVWCKEKGLITAIPPFPEFPRTSKGVRVGKQRQKARELSREEVDRVLAALPARSLRGRKRFLVQARFIVAWETTLRPATVSALRKGVHFKPGSKELAIPDEDDKARLGRPVPLSMRARKALETACLGLEDGAILFGHHDYRAHLRKAAAEAMVPYASVCAYDLRHARITDLVERSGNLPGVMHLAGHTQLGTTSRYNRPSFRAAQAALADVDSAQIPLPVHPQTGPDDAAPNDAAPTSPAASPGRWCLRLKTHAKWCVSGSHYGRDAVRRRGLEPLRELPHWNLNATEEGRDCAIPAEILSFGSDQLCQENAQSSPTAHDSGACTEIRSQGGRRPPRSVAAEAEGAWTGPPRAGSSVRRRPYIPPFFARIDARLGARLVAAGAVQ